MTERADLDARTAAFYGCEVPPLAEGDELVEHAQSHRSTTALAPMATDETPDSSAVAAAMQHAWDDFVGDTGCYPDCFERKGGKLYADFTVGNFSRMVAGALSADARRAEGSENR